MKQLDEHLNLNGLDDKTPMMRKSVTPRYYKIYIRYTIENEAVNDSQSSSVSKLKEAN